MNVYADTSFLISLYGRDDHTPKADAVVQATHPTFLLTPFGEAEFANACEFRVFLKLWTPAEARAVRERLIAHLRSGVFQSHPLTDEVWQKALSLSRRHTAKLGTRSLDVIHVASALILKPDAFCSFDDRQRRLAKKVGLRILPA